MPFRDVYAIKTGTQKKDYVIKLLQWILYAQYIFHLFFNTFCMFPLVDFYTPKKL